MDPVTIGLTAVSLIGGLFGKNKKPKPLTPEQIRALFGPGALAADIQELFGRMQSSPYGRQMLASAAEQGQNFQTEMASRAAESGLSPDQGAQSGASDFAVSAATGATAGLQRAANADLWREAMQAAQQNLAMRAGLVGQSESQRMAQDPGMNWMGNLGQAAQLIQAVRPTPAAQPTTAAPAAGGQQFQAAGAETMLGGRMGPTPFQAATGQLTEAQKAMERRRRFATLGMRNPYVQSGLTVQR